jgi:small subunit ribosomal protein S1
LAWRRIRRPEEVLQTGDEIEVYVLRLDHQRRRISLSLKRLHPSPWGWVDEVYSVDQLVCGVVTNVVKFGAFVALEIGVEGLVHVSELADPPPSEPREVVQVGD